MADAKISELTELAVAPATDDVLAIVDTSATTTKKITTANLVPRKWGWQDEYGKRRVSVGLQKEGEWTDYASNPVLTVGAAGSWDALHASWPCVVKPPNEDTYYMFYTGKSTTTAYAIGVATSTDLVNWTKYASNPIMVTDQAYEGYTGGATGGVAYQTVIYDEWETDSNKRWKLWYQCNSNGTPRDNLAYAYASSPYGPWTKYASNPVVSGWGLNYGCSVTRAGERYIAFLPKLADGDYYIHTSNDGITWTDRGKFLTHTAANLEATSVRYGAVFKGVDGWYFMYAANRVTPTPILNICIASASNPFLTWTRDPLHDVNPIITTGTNCFCPSLVPHNDQFIVYFGYASGTNNVTGMAYLKGYAI